MEEIGLSDIKKAQQRASERAAKLNKALNLPYLEVRNAKLVSVAADGQETVIGKPRFGTTKIGRKSFRLDDR